MWQTRVICLVLIILSGVFASFFGGIIPYSLFYFSLMIPVVSFLYTFYVFLQFCIYQTVEKPTLVKKEISEYEYQIVNEHLINFESIRVNFFDDYSNILNTDNKEFYCLVPGDKIVRKTKICCNYRGRYHVGIKSVEIQDFLHLFSITYPLLTHFHVTVLPRIISVDKVDCLSWNQDHKVIRGFMKGEETERTSEVRTFLTGDEKRLIHWKASAKMGELMVRKVEAIPKPEIAVYMDCSNNDNENNYQIYDQIIECALAIIWYSLTKEQQGSCLIYNRNGRTFYQIRNEMEFEEFYHQTVDLGFQERSSFLEFLKNDIALEERGKQVVVITQKLEKEYLVFGTECMKRGILLSIICVQDVTDEIKEWLPFFQDAGIHFVLLQPSDSVRKVLEEGVM